MKFCFSQFDHYCNYDVVIAKTKKMYKTANKVMTTTRFSLLSSSRFCSFATSVETWGPFDLIDYMTSNNSFAIAREPNVRNTINGEICWPIHHSGRTFEFIAWVRISFCSLRILLFASTQTIWSKFRKLDN